MCSQCLWMTMGPGCCCTNTDACVRTRSPGCWYRLAIMLCQCLAILWTPPSRAQRMTHNWPALASITHPKARPSSCTGTLPPVHANVRLLSTAVPSSPSDSCQQITGTCWNPIANPNAIVYLKITSSIRSGYEIQAFVLHKHDPLRALKCQAITDHTALLKYGYLIS